MLLFFFILFPLLLMGMFGNIYPPVPKSNPTTGSIGTAFPNLPVSLVQMDDGQTASLVAAQFIQISTQQRLFKISDSASYQTARNQLVEGNLKGIIIIPQGFSDALAAGQPATVQVTVDETNPTTASVVQSEISAVFNIIGSSMSTQNINNMSDGKINPTFIMQPISVTNIPLISGVSSSFQFLAPGFMALTVITGSLQGVATAISREKEQGTMDGLLASPIPHISIILGKVACANRTRTNSRLPHPWTIHVAFRRADIRQPNHHVRRFVAWNSKFRWRRHNHDCYSSRPRNRPNDDNDSPISDDVHQRNSIPNRPTPGMAATDRKSFTTLLRSRCSAQGDNSQRELSRHHA